MDQNGLAQWVIALLAPALPYLLARGKDFATAVAEGLIDKAKAEIIETVWGWIVGSDSGDSVRQAAEELVDQASEEGRLALEEELAAALAANQELAEALRKMAGQGDISPLRTSYMSWVMHRAGALPLADIIDLWDDPHARGQIRLDRVYIDLDTLVPERQEGVDLDLAEERLAHERGEMRRLSAIEVASRSKYLVITGDPGAGKSTFIKFLALCLAGEYVDDSPVSLARLGEAWEHGPLWPVYVELRHFAVRGLRHSCGLWEFIRDELPPGLEAFREPLLETLQASGGLILLDGLDEVPEADACREGVIEAVEAFKALFPRCRLAVTSRTYAYHRQGWRLPEFADAELAPFSPDQQEAFIDGWFESLHQVRPTLTRDEAHARGLSLKQEIAARPGDIGELAERPLLLTLMAGLRANRPDPLPPRRAEVYGQMVELLLRRWERLKVVVDENGEPTLQPDSLSTMLDTTYDLIRCALEQAAFEAHGSSGATQDVADIDERDLAGILLEVSRRGDLDIADVIEFLQGRAGLIEPHGEGVYRFPHRTFQEYMAAAFLCREEQDFPDQLVEKVCQDPELWREVTLLAAGQKDFTGVFALVSELVPDLPGPGAWPAPDDPAWWQPWLAGQVLVETGHTRPSQTRNKRVARQTADWLAGLLTQGALPPVDRAEAGRTLAKLGDPRRGVGLREDGLPDIDWVEIPEGAFIYDDESEGNGPVTLTLPTFHIARYPITYTQFQAFIDAEDGFYNPVWWRGLAERATEPGGQWFNYDNHPRETVSWYDAIAFCRWLTAQYPHDLLPFSLREKGSGDEGLGLGVRAEIRLPTEQEGEKAARGGLKLPDGKGGWVDNPMPNRECPWGDKYIAGYANIDETWDNTGPNYLRQTSAVGMYPRGASPYGVLDMSGNVWEWCLNEYENPTNTGLGGGASRVVRGGSWGNLQGLARCACRDGVNPSLRDYYMGFRVVCLPPSLKSS